MSIDATIWVWKLTKQQVTPTEKLILLAIADRCGEEGECWPSLSRLVRDTGYHRDAIIQNRKSLIGKGILILTGEYKGRSKQIPIMKLMCDEWRKGDPIDDEFDQSSKTTSRFKRLVPVVQDDTYQSSRTTQNLKEEPKRLINNISASGESPNIGYTESDGEEGENQESDYNDNQGNEVRNDTQVIEAEKKPPKSDYFENQIKNQSVSKLSITYDIKNIQENNIFHIPEQMLEDWITNRKKKRAPVTKTAWDRMNKELSKCSEQGIDPVKAFEKMVTHAWQALDADWFSKDKSPSVTVSQWDVDSVMRA